MELQDFSVSQAGDSELPQDFSENSHSSLSELKSSSELALLFGVDRKTIQKWFGVVSQAYYWLPESRFKSGSGKYVRYTVFCADQMRMLQAATKQGQTYDQWIATVQSNAEIQNEEPVTVIEQVEIVAYVPSAEQAESFKPAIKPKQYVVTDTKQLVHSVLTQIQKEQEIGQKNTDAFNSARRQQRLEKAALDEVETWQQEQRVRAEIRERLEEKEAKNLGIVKE